MKTCFSSLRLLSSRMDRYRSVHSSVVVMIMAPPPLLLGCYPRRRRRRLPSLASGPGPCTGGPAAAHTAAGSRAGQCCACRRLQERASCCRLHCSCLGLRSPPCCSPVSEAAAGDAARHGSQKTADRRLLSEG